MTSSQNIVAAVWLDDAQALDSSLAGEKAASLSRLRQNGLPVPDGFVILAPVFADVIRDHQPDIQQLLEQADEDPSQLDVVSRELQKLVAGLQLPTPLRTVVSERYKAMGRMATVAVRSSGTAEDLPGASFAGQYDSALNVRGVHAILDQVKSVWASTYTQRAIAYRQQQQIPHLTAGMAVLIQTQLGPDASGVIFTCDPVTGDSDRMVINASFGLGAGVVDGKVRADTFVLDSDSLVIVDSTIATKTKMIERVPGGGIAEKMVSIKHQRRPALTEVEITQLACLAQEVTKLEGDERDIEFACVKGSIHLLQSRPVTGIAEEPAAEDPTVKEKDFPVVWEDSADALSLWILRSWGRATPNTRLEEEIQHIVAVHQRRVYEDTGVPMARAHDLRSFNGYIYFREPAESEEEIAERRRKHQEYGKRYSERGASYYVEVIEPEAHSIFDELGSFHRPRDEHLTSRIDFLEQAINGYGRVMGDLHWRMVGGGGFEEWSALYHEITGRPAAEAGILLQAIDNRTTQMVRRLRALARVVQSDLSLRKVFEKGSYEQLTDPRVNTRRSFRTFNRRFRRMLQVFGRRTGYSYGSSTPRGTPTWNLDHTIPLDIIATYARQDLDELDSMERRARRERVNGTRRARRSIADDTKRIRFDHALAQAKQQIRNMENHNYLMEQGVSGVLNEATWWVGMQLAGAGRIENLEDVTHLTIQDLRAAATHDGDLRSLIRERKEEFHDRSQMEPPRTLGKGELPERSRSAPSHPDGDDHGGTLDALELRGVAASRGRHTGQARVFLTPAEMPEVERGDILVARDAGQDWAPVMQIFGGIVLDEGVTFQHAALIAREYGIPCVIQTRRGTEVIHEGQQITIDGTEGVVELTKRRRPMA